MSCVGGGSRFEMKNFRVLILLAVFAVTPIFASVWSPPGSLDLRKLWREADVVIMGTVIRVDYAGQAKEDYYGRSVSMKQFQALISVQRWYKGAKPNSELNVQIRHFADEGLCGVGPCQSLSIGDHKLLFLNSSGSIFRLTTEVDSSLEVSDRVSSFQTNGDIEALTSDLIAGLSDSNRSRVIDNITLLGALRDKSASSALKSFLISSDLEERGWTYLSFLRISDISLLSDIYQFAKMPSSDPHISMIQQLLSTEVATIRDPAAEPTLEEMVTAKSSRLRFSAFYALRKIQDPTTLPVFIRGLDDADQNVRYTALMGLAETEGREGDWAPSIDLFQKAESKYILLWKDWWQSEVGQRAAHP